MRAVYFATALAGVLGLTLAQQDSVDESTTNPRNEPLGIYMAELADGVAPEQLVSQLSAANITINIRQTIDSKLFHGVSFTVDTGGKTPGGVESVILAAASTVRQVWPVRAVSKPNEDVRGFVGLNTTADVQRRAVDERPYYPHVMSQIDLLHKAGFTGEGMRIAVVDTGIDYLHPILGGCFGPGCIVTHGWDAVGIDDLFGGFDGMRAPEPDGDPMDCDGHGTHIAGIISALPNEFGFIGAAPGARLGAYRAMDCNGYGTEETIVAAMLRAFEDGHDIMTMSVGLSGGIPDSLLSLTATRIIEAGVPVFVAIGNDGVGGTLFKAVSPAEGRLVNSVSSYDPVEEPAVFALAEYAIGDAEPQQFPWATLMKGRYEFESGADQETLPLLNLHGLVVGNTSVTGCTPIPDSVPDLSGYLVLVSLDRPAGCYFRAQRQNIIAKGGALMMFWGTDLQIRSIINDDPTAFVATTTTSPAKEWIEALAAGQNVTVTMTVPSKAESRVVWSNNDATGGQVSNYSTWGPTYDLRTGPTFGGPGRSIMSTYLQNGQGVVTIGGTSMAAPLVAASAILLMQARNISDPRTLQNLLASTAIQPRGPESPLQAGAGLIQLWDAAQAKGILSVSGISFNDSDNHPEDFTFILRNTGDSDAVYDLGHTAVSTMYAMTPEGRLARVPFEVIDVSADITFAADQALVSAGGETNITVRCVPPEGVDKARWPIYSGYITLNSTNGDSLSIPYVGNAGSMREAVIIDGEAVTFWPRFGAADEVVTLPRPTIPGNASFDALSMNVNPYLPSKVFRFDIVAPASSNGTNDQPGNSSNQSLGTGEWLGRKTYGQTWGSPFSLLAGSAGLSTLFAGFLATGELLPAGRYAILTSALRLFADPASEDEADWQVVETPPFLLRYQE
ncbi:serine endopeptidase [Diaporthe helianthi]|uniref:Serine endopeptidase n=1 Tax=Diaporthe helianthi TaxID=158607 RepID=A0A2P5ICQ6_DIAHE|nr:serine endopeptidase [Diaporthe helianthi]